MKVLPAFYKRDNPVEIARSLLGKLLFTNINQQLTCGIIVETEAYIGPDDRGSHAWNNRRTPRNETMYAEGGVIYMYICYGIHDMLNIVTGKEGSSHAILIRAAQPCQGIEYMRDRRKIFNNDFRLCQGPGALASAFGLNKTHNGLSLQSETVWITEPTTTITYEIAESARIGMNFEGPYKNIPWRFYLRGNRFVSRNNK